ncbi:MAG: RagB/SusD family nutrient uptake outer membrane protein, partial [Alistipes sp.]|nr:RagB/SusD family nutrient uptake outer membrane protein [Alistipes sp.]
YYAQVVSLVKQMEQSTDGYALIPVANRFTKAGEYSTESVFEIGAASFLTGDGSYQGWQVQGTRGDPNWGWGFIAPSLNLVQSYEAGDLRAETDIIYGHTTIFSGMQQTPSVIANTTITGAYYANDTTSTGNGYPNRFSRKAYQPRPVSGGNENYGGNLRMMRWAEVLLIGAEAAMQTGDSKASEWYNAVRTRAGLESQTPTLERIWEEKRMELCLERDRYFDLVRIDKIRPGYFAQRVWAKMESEQAGLTQMQAAGLSPASTTLPLPSTSPVSTPKNYVLPIPNAQILLMNKLVQNEGY